MLQRRSLLTLASVLGGAAAFPLRAHALTTGEKVNTADFLQMVTGVRYHDDPRGTGPEPQKGQTVTVTYTGWLFNDPVVGRKFDSSADHGGQFRFTLGTGQVIAGWDQGVSTMRVGGTRTMILPSRLAYGSNGAGDAIPPDATLIFVVQLLAIG